MVPTLTKFLELPNVFDQIFSELQNEHDSGLFKSILDGEIWKTIKNKFTGKIVLPLLLFFDDFEINNPLGSHSVIQKLGAIYYTIACIPHKYRSKLENIFLAQLHRTKDVKSFGINKVFKHLVEELSVPETNGVTINVNGQVKTVYFVLAAFIGDNLGLNELFGLSTSFNANYCCRICSASSYILDLENLSNGIVQECILNELKNFHITENITVDIMHDMMEGICRYELGEILYHFIMIEQLFSLQTFNSRLRFFDFGDRSSLNKPTSISDISLRKKVIICSASEMLCIIKYVGFIIGDFVPENNKV
ncbi:uncharacterized protein [Prorops nasuta]|uniref:uncharacterized protein n=1 Tax=Prorops nasuta TaxID=863751 RepID=UPI0034CE2605